MDRIAFFEDGAATQFGPLTLLRPVFELVCGHFSLRERLIRRARPLSWGAFLREALAATYGEQHPAARVNDMAWLREGPTLLVNGRWLTDPAKLSELGEVQAAYVGDTLVALRVMPDDARDLTADRLSTDLERIAEQRERCAADGVLLEFPWDVVSQNAEQLAIDFRARAPGRQLAEWPAQVCMQGSHADVHVDATAQLDPFVVIDARRGPVWIDAGARVQPFTRIEGPAFIGEGAQLFRANVRGGTTIGPHCRAGGEIEESILHGYVNKYHDGFLGHSYVCPWVNLGALTTNSDLKNDYSSVRVPLWGESMESGSLKVGCFIGDHTKTALGSLFNSGSAIGVMCMVLPSGELLPKHVPSFTRLWHGVLEDLPEDLEAAIAAARAAMARRQRELTAADVTLLQWAYAETSDERAIARTRARR